MIMNYNPGLNKRDVNGNKGTFGRVLVIAGSESMSGCVFFSCLGALRSGAGLVYALTDVSNVNSLKILAPEVITNRFSKAEYVNINESQTFKDNLSKLLENADSVVIGPGLTASDSTYELVKFVFDNYSGIIVVDADALNSISSKESLKDILSDDFKADVNHILYNKGKQRTIVITPHLKELSRLINESVDACYRNIDDIALKLSSEFGIITVIKDHKTRISDGENVYVNTTGNSALATAGSGDILSGMIAALILQDDFTFKAVNTAVHLHGLAGDLASKDLSEYGCIARDILDYIPKAFVDFKKNDRFYTNCVIYEVMNGR